jgi:hypothetical protein
MGFKIVGEKFDTLNANKNYYYFYMPPTPEKINCKYFFKKVLNS